MTQCPHCSTPLTLTLAAQPKVEPQYGSMVKQGDYWYSQKHGTCCWRLKFSEASVLSKERAETVAKNDPTLICEVVRVVNDGTGWKEVDPVPATPAKVIKWQDGDWWATYPTDHLYRIRGDRHHEFRSNGDCWGDGIDPSNFSKLSDSEGDARAAALGYTVNRKPTPASDSVKGERDRHGREIVKREGHAMIVDTDDNSDDCYLVVSGDLLWWNGDDWSKDKTVNFGCFTLADAELELVKAAATPLPTPSPAAVEAKPYAFNGPIPSGPSAAELSDLRLRVSDLEKANQSLTADLERYRDRLAKVEGSLNKGNA